MKDERDFEVGETVYLNSGSPALTITGKHGASSSVTWICDGSVQRATFPNACITRVKNA